MNRLEIIATFESMKALVELNQNEKLLRIINKVLEEAESRPINKKEESGSHDV